MVSAFVDAFAGPGTFNRGLQLYLSQHAYANANPSDLWAAQAAVSGLDVPTMMANWTALSGFPVIRLSQSGDGNGAVVTQQEFLWSPSVAAPSPAPRWWVPLTFAAKQAPPAPAVLTVRVAQYPSLCLPLLCLSLFGPPST